MMACDLSEACFSGEIPTVPGIYAVRFQDATEGLRILEPSGDWRMPEGGRACVSSAAASVYSDCKFARLAAEKPKPTYDPFWLVWCVGGGNPTYKHRSEQSARTEAERLARNTGKAFAVLQCVGMCERPENVEWLEVAMNVMANQGQRGLTPAAYLPADNDRPF